MHSVTCSYVLLLLVLANAGMSHSSPRLEDSVVKQNGAGKWVKSRESNGKEVVAREVPSLVIKRKIKAKKLKLNYNYGAKVGVETGRQGGGGGWGWGWGWPSHGGAGGGGGYDVLTIIGVATFAALFGALIYELIMGGTMRRSFDTAAYNLPPITLGLDSEKLPEVMVKIGDWIANSAWVENLGNKSRTIRDLRDKVGLGKWYEAFKKDPVEYQCIRKMACESLATSPLVERSLKTNLGGVFLTAFGNFIENGEELQDLVRQIAGNLKKCDELVVGGYCEEN